jgi:hypothetical protein
MFLYDKYLLEIYSIEKVEGQKIQEQMTIYLILEVIIVLHDY